MWLLIVPLVILVVIVLGIASLTGAAFGLLGAHWPWVLIGVGIWLFWAGDGRHRRRHRHARHDHAPAPDKRAGRAQRRSAPQPVELVPATAPIPLRKPDKPELPIDVQVKVEQIRRKVDVMLGFADRFPPFSQDLFLVRQTANEYLPRTIDTYLALPQHAAERPMGVEGKTPHQELVGQLELLDAKLDEIALDLQRQDMDRLLANRRFLEDRFGKASA